MLLNLRFFLDIVWELVTESHTMPTLSTQKTACRQAFCCGYTVVGVP
jgi:hypothetical protein